MELEEALKILKEYLCETHRKFCSIGAVGIPNKEYFAVETVLNHLTKQEKMIELMAIKIKKQISCYDPCWLEYEDDNIKCYGQENCKECIKQYFEKKAEE